MLARRLVVSAEAAAAATASFTLSLLDPCRESRLFLVPPVGVVPGVEVGVEGLELAVTVIFGSIFVADEAGGGDSRLSDLLRCCLIVADVEVEETISPKPPSLVSFIAFTTEISRFMSLTRSSVDPSPATELVAELATLASSPDKTALEERFNDILLLDGVPLGAAEVGLVPVGDVFVGVL